MMPVTTRLLARLLVFLINGRNPFAAPRVDDRGALVIGIIRLQLVAAGDNDCADGEQLARGNEFAVLFPHKLKATETEAKAGGQEHTDADPSVHGAGRRSAPSPRPPQGGSGGHGEQRISRGFGDASCRDVEVR